MTTSESPTHPDAPRAGGETPEMRVDNLLRDFQSICERAHDEAEPYWRNAAVKERAILRNQLRSALLERHRDGERERFEARVGRMTLAGELRVHRASVTPGHFVARHVPSSIDACELSAELAIRAVLRELDAAMSASPDPERASK